jgi:putative hemolysin
LTPHKVKSLSESKAPYRALFRKWIEFPNQILTTILIGNNVVNISASALATDMSYGLFGHMGPAFAVGIMTILILFFGEIFPKSFAQHNAERIAAQALRFLSKLHWLLYPIILPITKLTNRVILASGGRVGRKGPVITEKDLTYYLGLARSSGVLDKKEEEMIASAIRFNDKLVKNVMIPRNEVSTIPADIKFDELIDTLTRLHHSRYPVYFQNVDHIVGVMHAKEILSVVKEQPPKDFSIYRYVRQPYFVSEFRKIHKVFEEMKTRKMHMAVVKDENNQFSGIITMEDILEELVGEIQDEYDEESNESSLTERFLEVTGKTTLLELERALDVKFPHSPAYTNLNGFILYLTGGELPKVETRLYFGQLEFIVIKTDTRSFVEVIHIKKHEYNWGPGSHA